MLGFLVGALLLVLALGFLVGALALVLALGFLAGVLVFVLAGAFAFVPREGPGLAFFFAAAGFFLRLFGRRRSISAIKPRRASWTPSATRRALSEM